MLLPTYYYHDHFAEMLAFVEGAYDGVLDDAHRAFIKNFRGLNKSEQCLYVRMANRRGRIFPRVTLRYAEIENIDDAIETLRVQEFIRAIDEQDYDAWLSLLKKDDLLALAQSADVKDIKKSWSKPKLAQHLLENLDYELAAEILNPRAYVVQERGEVVEFLLYLYFGKTFDDLKSFALRDLGVIGTNAATTFSARFTDRDEAHGAYFYHTMLDRIGTGRDSAYEQAADALMNAKDIASDYVHTLKGRAAYKIGQFFEKHAAFDQAMFIYRCAPTPENNERVVRILHKQGDRDAAKDLLERMIDDPGSDDEHNFASDFYARHFEGKRIGACTDLLRKAQNIAIDEIHRNAPEEGVAGIFRRDGWRVEHVENGFWQALFGLIFWDELFESGQLHNGFDWFPHALKNKTFAKTFAAEIETKLAAIRAGKALPHVLKTIATHWDKPNGIFGWYYVDIDAIRDFLAHAPKDGVARIVELMTRDYASMHDGFPDLLLIRDNEIRFTEVKAQGDVIRRHQLTRLRQLQTAGFHADICRVDYRYDPEQIYTVVDIETTGQHRDFGRITEIAAVKMQGGEIIDEWQTLLNPQRPIPAFITQLTGITNAMVADAPLFSAVADDLRAFLADTIFVAHNVGFDYGFIAAEYDRLEQSFRMPKFCTVSNMRRHYPGHKSYSLGSLCEIYDIELKNHHRAMSDARAAAALLVMINRKREDQVFEDKIAVAAE